MSFWSRLRTGVACARGEWAARKESGLAVRAGRHLSVR